MGGSEFKRRKRSDPAAVEETIVRNTWYLPPLNCHLRRPLAPLGVKPEKQLIAEMDPDAEGDLVFWWGRESGVHAYDVADIHRTA